MITLKQEEKLIDRLKSLTELELQSIIDDFKEHAFMNSLQHIFVKAFDIDEVVEANEELTEENSRLEDQIHRLNDEIFEHKIRTDQAMKVLHDEDKLAARLSELSPMDYESLMKKVKRTQWNVSGFQMYKRTKQ